MHHPTIDIGQIFLIITNQIDIPFLRGSSIEGWGRGGEAFFIDPCIARPRDVELFGGGIPKREGSNGVGVELEMLWVALIEDSLGFFWGGRKDSSGGSEIRVGMGGGGGATGWSRGK